MHAVTVSRDGAGSVRVFRRYRTPGAGGGPAPVAAPRPHAADDRFQRRSAPAGVDHPLLDDWPRARTACCVVDRPTYAHAVAASIALCVAALVAAVVWGHQWRPTASPVRFPWRSGEARRACSAANQYGFESSTLAAEREAELRSRFARVVAAAAMADTHRLEFRSAEEIGANALALPGGTIVVTDQLVDVLSDDRAFDAIVAHELGHQRHRHALRQTLRSSFVIVLAAFFARDVSAASSVVVGVPTFLLQSHYSRGFEEEPPCLRRAGGDGESPAWFAEAMRSERGHEFGEEEYLSTHPSALRASRPPKRPGRPSSNATRRSSATCRATTPARKRHLRGRRVRGRGRGLRRLRERSRLRRRVDANR